MSEKFQSFEIPEEEGVVIHEDIIPVHISEAEKESGISDVTNLNESPDSESIEIIEMSELPPATQNAVMEFTNLTPENQGLAAEVGEGTEAMALNALDVEGKSNQAARVAAVGGTFAAVESPENAEKAEQSSGLLKKLMNGSLKAVRHVTTGVVVAIAAFSHTDNAEAAGYVDFIPVVAGVVGAQNPRLGKTIEGGVIRPIERGVQGGQRIERMQQQQQNLAMQHEKLDREKEELLLRAGGNSRIAEVESRVENRTQPMQMEARYDVSKAQLKTQRAEARAAFLSKPNPSAAEQARYEAQIAKLNEQEIRLDATTEIKTVKDEVRRDTKSLRAEHGVANIYDQIDRKNIKQAQIRTQIEKLNMDMAKMRYTTSRDMARDVFRNF